MKNHLTSLLAAALALAPVLVSCGGEKDTAVHVTSVTLRQPTLTLAVGDISRLTATVEPSNATDKKLNWKSSNFLVASVDQQGNVTGLRSGRTTVVVSSVDGGKMAACSVTVGPDVTAVFVEPSTMNLTLSGMGAIVARVEPYDAVNQKITWTSNNTSVATANPLPDDDLVCHVRAVSAGNARITAIAVSGGFSASCDVRVETGPVVNVTGVELNKESTTIGMGSAETLVATVQPDDATFRAVRWSSSDAAVATVSGSGVVTAVSPGSAVITAGTVDTGAVDVAPASCEVTVASVYTAGFEFSPNGVSVSRLWKDGVSRDLSNGANTARANSVCVVGGDVYAAGFENNFDLRPVARLWLNGNPVSLSTGVNPTEAKSVFVSNNVYVVGVERDGQSSMAKLWIDGHQTNLSSGSRSAEARSVFVPSDNLYYYVAGYEVGEQGRDVARLWTNDQGQLQQLSNGSMDEQAMSVYVSNGNAYVAGFGKNGEGKTVARLWINGAPLNLSDGRRNARANAVFVTDNNTYYVVGHEYNANGVSVAKLWTNDAAHSQNQDLSNGATNADALSVYVIGNGVYVVGSEENITFRRPTGRLWLNGTPQPLGNGIEHSEALAVFLK